MAISESLKRAQAKYDAKRSRVVISYHDLDKQSIDRDVTRSGKTYKEIFEIGLMVVLEDKANEPKLELK